MVSIPKQTEIDKLSRKMEKVIGQFDSLPQIRHNYLQGLKYKLSKEIDKLDCPEEDKILAKQGVFHKQ
jgi:hypothetical protein